MFHIGDTKNVSVAEQDMLESFASEKPATSDLLSSQRAITQTPHLWSSQRSIQTTNHPDQ